MKTLIKGAIAVLLILGVVKLSKIIMCPRKLQITITKLKTAKCYRMSRTLILIHSKTSISKTSNLQISLTSLYVISIQYLK